MSKILFLLLALPVQLLAQQTWPQEIILTPEKSNFIKTSTYADVISFLDAIHVKSENVHVISMGKSLEGKEIPVAILANPQIKTPAEAKATGKTVIYIQGNIHAGEVEGKEAVMMLMRDILLGDKKNLLDNQIILFAPIYNTDSNDKMEKGLRTEQEDSPLEVGLRANSQGLDLNRDGVKLEAFETKGLFKNIILPWDPYVFVDLHTTNGSWHGWNLTWAPSYHYTGEKLTYDYTVDRMLKEISKKAKQKYDLNLGPYGDYELSEGWPPKNFYTYDYRPMFLVNQFSLRNRLAILSEAFSHERFYQRIYSTYSFMVEILEHTNQNGKEIQDVIKKAEQQTVQNVQEGAGKIKKGVRFKMVPLETLNDFPTYDFIPYPTSDSTTGYYRTGKIVRYQGVQYHAKFEAEVESTLPRGYVIPAAFTAVVDNLRDHGIVVTMLTKSQTKEGEVFLVEKLTKAKREFQKHFTVRATGKFVPSKQKFNKGDYVVDLAQPLGNLAFYLLEPESDNGLVMWNFFDAYFEKAGLTEKPVAYPILKYYK